MIVLFDTSTLTYLFKPDAPGPFIAGGEERLADWGVRIAALLAELQRARATIVIPTPVIAELLVLAGSAGPDRLRILITSRHFRLAPFDVLAAVECAEMVKARAGVRMGKPAKAKAKFDEQIVAIGLIEHAEIIYSDDRDIRAIVGDNARVKVLGMADIPLPPSEAQRSFDLEPAPPMPAPPPDDE